MRAWNILLLMLMAALAGCSSDDGGDSDPAVDAASDTPETDDGADEQGAGDAGSDEAAGGDDDASGGAGGDLPDEPEETNAAPTALLEASIQSADVPFNVNFTLDGEDPDGDELSWTFDADGDGAIDTEGTGLPFNFTYSYNEAGNYTARLEVTDGQETDVAELPIEGTEFEAPPEPEPELFEMSCTADVGAGNPVLSPSISAGVANIGGCNFGTFDADREFHSQVAPDGCNINFDADGDNFSDGSPEPGTTYLAGTNFFMGCDIGVLAAEGTISFLA